MTDTADVSLAERVDALDWGELRGQLDGRGFADTTPMLGSAECQGLAELFDGGRFPSTIDMARHRFGDGRYRYFDHPLPEAIEALRTSFYGHLAPIANEGSGRISFIPPSLHPLGPPRMPDRSDPPLLEGCAERRLSHRAARSPATAAQRPTGTPSGRTRSDSPGPMPRARAATGGSSRTVTGGAPPPRGVTRWAASPTRNALSTRKRSASFATYWKRPMCSIRGSSSRMPAAVRIRATIAASVARDGSVPGSP
jgi:Oxygenase, catalysing oxidative methylation of damaged DNA